MKQRSNPLSWITVDNAKMSVDEFPDGSFRFGVVLHSWDEDVTITLKSTLPEAIIALYQVVDAIYESLSASAGVHLVIQTLPDQRADRPDHSGQCTPAIVTGRLLAGLDVSTITVFDPHSNVIVEEIGSYFAGDLDVVDPVSCFNIVQHVGDLDLNVDFVVAVDKGAMARASQIAEAYDSELIIADKKRVEGKVVGHQIVSTTRVPRKGDTVWIVDDLCDGGATFISIAKLLREEYDFDKLNLYVTHGLFSKGKDELNEHYDNIVAYFDYY